MKSTILRSSLVLSLILSTICILVVNTQPMSREDQEVNNNPQSLPPDTFRQLAQALKNRDDKETHRLERKFLYNTSVTCNDGSRAGYYIRRNYQSKRWIVFLEGKKLYKKSLHKNNANEASIVYFFALFYASKSMLSLKIVLFTSIYQRFSILLNIVFTA